MSNSEQIRREAGKSKRGTRADTSKETRAGTVEAGTAGFTA